MGVHDNEVKEIQNEVERGGFERFEYVPPIERQNTDDMFTVPLSSNGDREHEIAQMVSNIILDEITELSSYKKLRDRMKQLLREERKEKNNPNFNISIENTPNESLRIRKFRILNSLLTQLILTSDHQERLDIIDDYLNNQTELYAFRSDSYFIKILYPFCSTAERLDKLKADLQKIIDSEMQRGVHPDASLFDLPERASYQRVHEYSQKLRNESENNKRSLQTRLVAREKADQLDHLLQRLSGTNATRGKEMVEFAIALHPIFVGKRKLPLLLSNFSSEPRSIRLIKDLRKSVTRQARRTQLNPAG